MAGPEARQSTLDVMTARTNYIGPGHIPTSSEPGTEYLQFSPADELQAVSETITRNAQQLQQQPTD